MEFAELTAKTNYSFLEGASHPEELVAQAHFLGYHSIAIADKNGVYGIPRAHVAAKGLPLKLIVGAEVHLREAQTLVCLAKNRNGYGNLCEMLTECHANRKDVHLPIKTLLEKGEDLFVLLPALGADETLLGLLKDRFPGRLYLLASRFHDGSDALSLKAAEHLASTFSLPVVASNQPLFHHPSRKPLQDVLTCIRHTSTLKNGGFRLLPNLERHLKSKEELERLFKDHLDWIERTVEIAEQCQFSLDEIRYHYPTEWIPKGETGDSYLEKLTWKGATRRYPEGISEAVVKQLRHELALIRELGYSDYFLTIWDIVQFARENKILCQGRGSAANSCVCYVLEITSIDPVRMDLLFERFISRERKEPPDIDIDFEHERREEVIQYIYQRYGRHRAAITAEVICFRRKSALREVAKVFEIPLESVERLLTATHRESLSKFAPETLAALLPGIPAKKLNQYFAITKMLLSFPRHLGTHVGGFVLCQEALTRNVPVESAAMAGRTIIQWDKNDLDALGFVKVDILGLGILTCIRKAFTYLEQRGIKMDLSTIPSEDPKIYEQVSLGDTVGVFQIESRAQMNMLPRLRPRNFFDLVVEISIVRPGPIQGEMVHPYLRRRAGTEAVEYAHPDLKAILQKTYGVPLFQEQIMKMAMVVAGFSAGEADELRRAMGTWQRHGRTTLSEMGDRFRQGLIRHGISPEFAERIFHQIEGFAEYGFPESHAASFALLAYATAYLKHYHQDIFVTALLNAQPMGFYSAQTLLYDAERHGVKLLPIDINHSFQDHLTETPNEVRLGFREIKGLPKRMGLAIETARTSGPFVSFTDFFDRVKKALSPDPLTKRELILLAGANAFASVGLPRREAWWEIQALLIADSRDFSPEGQAVMLPQEKGWEKISLDYESQGISLYAHPMSYLRKELTAGGALPSKELTPRLARRSVKVAGIVVSRQMPPSASGVLFITLEDEFGFINLVIWRKTYERFRTTLITQSFLWCEGKLEKAEDGNVLHVIVDSARPLLTSKRGIESVKTHDFH